MTEQQRFIVLGSGGRFTTGVLQTLLGKGVLPVGYLQAGPEFTAASDSFYGIRVETASADNGIIQRLQQQGVQCRFDTRHDIDRLAASFKADFLLVACWPVLLSAGVIASVHHAALNLHPSLLPKYRGSDPIAAQLAAADHRFGVTLHLLNDAYDSGDIVLQREIDVPNPPAAASVLRSAASVGAQLFIEALHSFHHPGWRLLEQK